MDQTESIKFLWNAPNAAEIEAHYDIIVNGNIGDSDNEKQETFTDGWIIRKIAEKKVAKRNSQFMNWLQTKNTYWRASVGSFMKNDTK